MNVGMLVSLAEDGPWCGTRPPGFPRPHPPRPKEVLQELFGPRPEPWTSGPSPDPWRAGPLPDPWRAGTVEIGLYGAITLHQMGRLVSGPAALGLTSAANILFDETCGTVPISQLIWWLLHRPPPPPPPWLNELTFAGEMLAFSQATHQEALAKAAVERITESLKQFGLQTEQARAGN